MRPLTGTVKKTARGKSMRTMTAAAEANQPQLTYSIAPTSVPVGSQQTFSFTAKNQSGATVTVLAFTDSITLGNLAQLTNTTISPVTPPNPWQATPNGATLQFWALSDVTFNNGDSVTFQFIVNVLATPGTALLSVTEVIGGKTAQAPVLTVLLGNALSISALANPQNVGQQRAVMLQWNTIGGEYVTISPGTGQQYPAGTSN